MKTALLVAAFIATGTLAAQKPDKATKPLPVVGLALAPLAGQRIPIMPTTYIVVVLPTMHPAGYPVDRARRLAWADSIIFDGFESRGPAVTWLSADEMRRKYKSNGAMLVDPDRMGQDMMASQNLKAVFDPLLGNLRRFAGMMDSRNVMIPATIRFSVTAGDSVRAEATYVLVDTRSGLVMWRSHPVGVALNAADALAATVAIILPDQH